MANRRLSSLSLQESSCPLRKQSYRLSEVRLEALHSAEQAGQSSWPLAQVHLHFIKRSCIPHNFIILQACPLGDSVGYVVVQDRKTGLMSYTT